MREVLIWSPEMSVGDEQIDVQHRKLLDTANMVRRLNDTTDSEIVKAAICEVFDYTIEHFFFEEMLLMSAGYADLAAHKALHDAIREEVFAVSANPDAVTHEILNEVMDRVIRHILITDRDYVASIGHVAGH